jgi:3-hydroxyisobutyrate dehydrogenase-like beta-hydroxyacid dehydrogenase
MNVGFAGLGRMGLPMARRLLAAGFPLAVWNRTASRAAALAAEGARVAATPRELAAGADVVVTIVTDAAALREVVTGANGVFGGLARGGVVVDMSTIGPVAARALADDARSHGLALLDAPVAGSVRQAEQGTLLAMVGGDAAALERAKPVLAAMTKAQMHLGPSGAGAAMKLANNAVVAITHEAIAEALVFAERLGIAGEAAYEVLANGAVASPLLLYKRAAFLQPADEPALFTLALMRKDLQLALDLAREHDVAMPATAAANGVVDAACAAGLADEDVARVLDVVARRRDGA